VVHVTAGADQARTLVSSGTAEPPDGWRRETLSLEEMVLGYLREPGLSVRSQEQEVTA